MSIAAICGAESMRLSSPLNRRASAFGGHYRPPVLAVTKDERIACDERHIDDLGFPFGLFQECVRFPNGTCR